MLQVHRCVVACKLHLIPNGLLFHESGSQIPAVPGRENEMRRQNKPERTAYRHPTPITGNDADDVPTETSMALHIAVASEEHGNLRAIAVSRKMASLRRDETSHP